MITNSQVRTEVAQDWAVVRKFCAGSHRQYAAAGAGGGPVFINETPPEAFYSLALLLACGVLDQVLVELRDQGVFHCPGSRPQLGMKMVSSQSALAWQNYTLVDVGKTARNDLAHKAKLVPTVDCLAFIEAIEVELKAWHIL